MPLVSPHLVTRRSSARSIRPPLHRADSSGREDEDEIPGCNIFLDNRLPVDYFKQDVLRLIHVLKIPRWKMVDASMASQIITNRISGALTNAVYSVTPPPQLKEIIRLTETNDKFATKVLKLPPKLLLRVYGSQVNHLINREKELAVIARLTRKQIGPRLLGTFQNGRFEQFFDARTLGKDDLRDPETSIQIAKRMRELHDNIKLLPEERAEGPSSWANLSKWSLRAKKVMEILELRTPGITQEILQVGSWDELMSMRDRYKEWLYEKYGGEERINSELVFAHNDTQYGNLLRLEPLPGSPLLVPKNEHKQLVVIDFEYSGANPVGVDIANHFCEWMSDYHAETAAHHIHEDRFPTKKEQLNLIQNYVEHGYASFDDEDKMAQDVAYIYQASIDWRPMVNLYWCIWGIVQAKMLEKDIYKFGSENNTGDSEITVGVASVEISSVEKQLKETKENELDIPVEDEEEDFFDYLAYSTQKVQLFWSDMIAFGLLDENDYHGTLKPIGGMPKK
ncbi:kinase-like protein [Nadsonia fulvescens var. elongata DSM 6958]|uniref:Kinase-like protein n=1 Tax=Nadsonia fulvescens var. elongata DSM 6958 TaxID=857566 RepID=A0A1E3PJ68_9ASCO|nr:kinase-like protein [Nadsonia fulvescens var. elongata DSM 6958]